jgi:hypothetical protein
LREAANNPVPLPQVRDLGRLIADIRHARALLDAVGSAGEPVTLEHVAGGDPRD